MSKKGLFTLLAAFAFFTLLGFLVARGSFLVLNEVTKPTPTFSVLPKTNQPILLLIWVNDLAMEDPAILSIWTATFSQGNSPQVILKTLYPTADKATDPALVFSFDENGFPSPWSLYQLNIYNVRWDGYILFDRAGLQWIVNTLVTSSSHPLDEASDILQYSHTFIQDEYDLYQDLCRLFPLQPSMPSWSEIVPTHLRSDLDPDTGGGFWQMLQEDNLDCQVVVPN